MTRSIGIPDSMESQADTSAPTAYVAHASGAVPVLSEAATDLDTTAAALVTAVAELTALTTAHNNLLAKLRINDYLDE